MSTQETSALLEAVCLSDLNKVKELIKKGDDVNFRHKDSGETPLHMAVPDLDMIKELVDAGANVNATDKLGCTPLNVAQDCGDKDALSYLESKGAKLGDPKEIAKNTGPRLK